MCHIYFESIRVENGNVVNLQYHQARVSKCSTLLLDNIVKDIILPNRGVCKLRITYSKNDFVSIHLSNYVPKVINTLKLVDGRDIDYSFKYNDRSRLDNLYSKKGKCDDIIVVKDGFITDTSFSNILFFDGKNWFTPKTPLLEGTCRARLIAEKSVILKDIKVDDLVDYNGFMLINAMLDFNVLRILPISNILL